MKRELTFKNQEQELTRVTEFISQQGLSLLCDRF